MSNAGVCLREFDRASAANHRSPGARRLSRHRRLAFEPLEDRRLLSVSAGLADSDLQPSAESTSALASPLAFADGGLVQAAGDDLQVDAFSVPALADWNADGLADLIVGEKTADGQGRVRVYLNAGATAAPRFDSFVYAQANGADLVVPAAGCMGLFPRPFDWNGDGLNDLVTGLADGRVQFWPNVGTSAAPQFGEPSFVQVGPAGAKHDLNVGAGATLDIDDWNADGLPDLVVGGLDGRIHVFLNGATTGAPDFQTDTILQAAGGDLLVPSGRSSPTMADFDADGRKDMVLGNTEGQLLLYRNTGADAAPWFDAPEPVLVDGSAVDLAETPRTRPTVCDWNADGLADLLVGAADGQVRLYLGMAAHSTADARSPLHVEDAEGQPVDVVFSADTLLVAVATWCPHSREFRSWLALPEVRQQTAGLDVVFVFSDESSSEAGSIYDPAFLDDLPGRAVFLAADSAARPESYPTVYDAVLGAFGDTHGVTAVESWLAAQNLSPAVSYVGPSTAGGSCSAGRANTVATYPLPMAEPSSVADGPAARVVEVVWQADGDCPDFRLSENGTVPFDAASTTQLAARFANLTTNTTGLASDGGVLSAVHAVTSAVELAAVGAVADGFLAGHASMLGLADPVDELVPQEVVRDQLGMTHVVYQQVYDDVPVLGGQLLVHLDADGQLSSANGRLVADVQLETTPAVSLDRAMSVANDAFYAQFGRPAEGSSLVVRSAGLYVVSAALLDAAADAVPRLIWEVQVVNEAAWIDVSYLVDAATGGPKAGY